MTADYQGILIIATVLAVGWLLVAVVSNASDIVAPEEPTNDWMPAWTHPAVPGWHETRFWMGDMQIFERVYWDGYKWYYEPPMGRRDPECYIQDREWKE